ncbi:helix-turn-helix domain-containing protein [Streptomyces scopuliridis]|uniref:helix-turn-helix domain-containing protein n=1 Tax=Streptomyces scopuliridis TaxID=452529 RepID=UPI0035DC0CDE
MPASDHPWILSDRRSAARGVQGWRIDRGLTQEKLAEMADIDRSTLQRIESGNWEIKLSHLSRIAHALGVRTTDLLTSPVPPAGHPSGRG